MQDLPPPKSFYQYVLPKRGGQRLASIIKIPPSQKPSEIQYTDLLCTEQDRKHIYEIISTMSENGKLSLLLKSSHLKDLGARVNHVHPLRFLETIFSNHYLKDCMYDIFDDYFKRKGFMDGLAPSLSREADKGNLFKHISQFAATVSIPNEKLEPFFFARDWEALVRFMISY